MDQTQDLARSFETELHWRRVGQVAVTAFVGILALAGFAPPMITAVLGIVLLTAGLLLAASLSIFSSAQSKAAWDFAALATFLGFAATLVSDVGAPAL